MKKASLTRRVLVAARAPALKAVAEGRDAVLDPQCLAGQAAEQHGAEHVQRAGVAPGQREVDADDERDEPQPGQHAVVQRLRQAPAHEDAQERAGQDGADVDERARQLSASSSTRTASSAAAGTSIPRPGPCGTGSSPALGAGRARGQLGVEQLERGQAAGQRHALGGGQLQRGGDAPGAVERARQEGAQAAALGRPQRVARRAEAAAAGQLHVHHVAGPPLGGRASRRRACAPVSSAAIGAPTCGRTSASSSSVAQGCSTSCRS